MNDMFLVAVLYCRHNLKVRKEWKERRKSKEREERRKRKAEEREREEWGNEKWRKTERPVVNFCNAIMNNRLLTNLSELHSGLLLLHPPVGNQVVKDFPYRDIIMPT